MKLDRIEKAGASAFADRLDRAPGPETEARLPDSFGRRFIVFGDCEEEFDWGAPLDRKATATRAIAALPEATRRFADHGIVPTYLVDWPVATNAASAATMAEMSAGELCDIGAHLHPWVNPPHEEEVSRPNSFAGALPPELELEKLGLLTQRLTALAGRPPVAYRAGRYGIGPETARSLRALGYRFDVSVRSFFDYSGEGGPDFTHHPIAPYWVDRDLLELPLTACLEGPLRAWPGLSRHERLRGPLARSGLFNRIPLTPEGVPLNEAKRAIETLLARGHRLFSLSFHTPTVEPGHTPYGRDAREVASFWAWWDGVFELFRRNDVTPVRADEIVAAAQRA